MIGKYLNSLAAQVIVIVAAVIPAASYVGFKTDSLEDRFFELAFVDGAVFVNVAALSAKITLEEFTLVKVSVSVIPAAESRTLTVDVVALVVVVGAPVINALTVTRALYEASLVPFGLVIVDASLTCAGIFNKVALITGSVGPGIGAASVTLSVNEASDVAFSVCEGYFAEAVGNFSADVSAVYRAVLKNDVWKPFRSELCWILR